MALKKHDKVEELLRMMWEQDNEEEISFNAIIHFLEYYASKEDWKSVESIFEKLKERKIELNNPTKEKINELGKKSERMQSFTITYSALLNEDTKPENSDSDFMENHEETREILEAILLSSFNPKVLESAFSRYLDLNCHFSHVMQVYSNLKKKYHLSNFPKLIVARYKNYDDVLDDVFKFAKEEYETRKEIEIYDFNSFMIKYLDLQRYNKVEEVLEFISMHEDMGRTPKTYVFAARYLNQLRKDGKLNQYLNNLLAKPSKPSLVYTSLIDFGIDLFGFEEINTALEGFSKFGFDPKADLAKRMKMRELREKSAKTENTVQEGEKNHKETLPNPESQNTK
jgi:ADP-ribose pyrophosphatase YjhB (NUDIX family)